MTDKESLEPSAGHQQKPTLFSPALTAKNSYETQSEAGSPSRYQNVIQKSRLIVPTALWVLIVVAGVCFLSLLCSLNRSINALDSLVEFEQAEYSKLKHDIIKSEKLEREPFLDEQEEVLRDSPMKWLTLPSWTSLEPVKKSKPASDPMETEIKSIFDGLFNMMNKDLGKSAHPVKGSMVIASSGPIPVRDGPIEDIMDQMMGELRPLEEPRKIQSPEWWPESQQSPVVSAHIDTVNIHINKSPTDEKSNKRPFFHHRNHPSHLIETGFLDKTLDDIMSDSNKKPDPISSLFPPTFTMIESEPLGSIRPSNKFDDLSPMSPLAKLLGLPIRPQDVLDDMMMPPPPVVFGQRKPTSGHLVITLSKKKVDGNEAEKKPKQKESPYEIASPFLPPINPFLGGLSDPDDKISSVIDGNSSPLGDSIGKTIPASIIEDSMIFVHGKPLEKESKKTTPAEESADKEDDKLPNLLKAMFGPPSKTESILMPQTDIKPFDKTQDDKKTTSSPLESSVTKVSGDEKPKAEYDEDKKGPAPSIPILSSITSEDKPGKELDDIFGNFVNNIFALPQIRGEESRDHHVGGSSSSSAPKEIDSFLLGPEYSIEPVEPKRHGLNES